MSSLRETRNKPGRDIGSSTAIKRKLPVDNVEVVSSKENKPAPKAPTRTKRQKLSITPAKPPRYVNPAIENLKKQIEREYSIRDGGAKLLQVSKTSRQSMEASKGLFVSDAKIIGYMRELQDKQNLIGELSPSSSLKLKPCKAQLAISEIRIPLEWREFEHTKGKLDSNLHGAFCLFRIGNQVMDTPTLFEVDRSTMDITFKDVIIFPECVDPDFTLGIEVYCSLPMEDSSAKPSTPIKILKKLRHKDKPEESPAHLIKSVPPSPYTPRALNVSPSHRFALAGYAQLNIKDVAGSCRTFALKRGMVGSCGTSSTGGTDDSMLLPLWGQICCCLMAQPECATKMRIAGFINVQRMVGGLPDWKRLWCVMRQNHMRCWSCPEDVGKKMPIHTIELSKSMTVESAPRLSMRRPNALLLKDRSLEFFMAFESNEDKAQWIDAINQGILDLKVWQSSCEFTIPVPTSKFYTNSSPSPDDIPVPAKSLPHPAKSAKPYVMLTEDETIL